MYEERIIDWTGRKVTEIEQPEEIEQLTDDIAEPICKMSQKKNKIRVAELTCGES